MRCVHCHVLASDQKQGLLDAGVSAIGVDHAEEAINVGRCLVICLPCYFEGLDFSAASQVVLGHALMARTILHLPIRKLAKAGLEQGLLLIALRRQFAMRRGCILATLKASSKLCRPRIVSIKASVEVERVLCH